jgi:hypothetical protein
MVLMVTSQRIYSKQVFLLEAVYCKLQVVYACVFQTVSMGWSYTGLLVIAGQFSFSGYKYFPLSSGRIPSTYRP